MVKQSFQVIWDDEAKASLRRIYNYIKKRESVEQAKKVRTEISALGKSLGFIPTKFSKDDLLQDESIRFRTIWSYKLVYEIIKDKVVILDVFHTSRDPDNLLRLKKK